MKSELIEAASTVIPDAPTLINLVSARIRELNDKDNRRAPLVQTTLHMGSADIALTEIIEGQIEIAPLDGE